MRAMTQATHQFSPIQILEAGQRAEAEGRIEYAIQFYRHLTDHLARTPEAGIARDALARLGAVQSAAKPVPKSEPIALNGTAGAPYGPGIASPAPPQGMAQSRAAPPPGGALVVRPPVAGGNSIQDAAARRRLLPPRSRRRYRSGRSIARLFTFLGIVEASIGIVMLVIGVIGSLGIGAMPEFMAAQQMLGFAVGVSGIVLGLAQVLGGQLARAMFDTASANRDIAAFARARAAYDAGVTEEAREQQAS